MKQRLKIFPLTGLVLSLGLFAASCSAAAPSATPTSPMTESATPQPSLTPSATPTATRRPLFAPLFVHTPSESVGGILPAAIAQPKQPQTSARLKDWTEQDAVDLIRQMDQYAHDTDTWGLASNRFTFIDSQLAVRFVVQEALDRFPNSQFKNDYLWELAFTRASRHEPGADEWLISHLDQALNQDGYSPETLKDLLGPYGFNANDLRPVPNLFGDGKTGWVFNIKTDKASIRDGLFLAIRQKTPSQYQVFTLVSAWNFFSGYSYIEDVDDINKNGIPDVHVYIGGHSGNMCQGVSQLYEWNGSAFYDISKGVLSLDACEAGGWGTGPNDKKGVPTLIKKHLLGGSKDQYTWNGKFYEFTGYFEATPLETWDYRANDRFNISYIDDVTLLPALLDSPEALKRGPAYPDYLRFRLGVAYAVQSKPQQAIKEMKALISTLRDSSVPIYAALAKKFLEIYKGDSDLYQACTAAHQLDQEIVAKRENDSAAIQKIYGFSAEQADSFGWHNTFPCDQSAAFAVLLKSLPANAKDVLALLQKNGVELAYSTSLDINADGQMEWLVVDAQDAWKNLNLITLQHGHFQVQDAGGSYGKIPETVQVVRWKDIPDPVLFLRSKDSLDVFTVSKNFETNSLVTEWKLKNFSVSDEQSAPEMQLIYEDAAPEATYRTPWAGYRWDAETGTFKDDLLEYKLFVEHNPKAAVEIAAKSLPLFDRWTKQLNIPYTNAPHDYYLVALAYELAGDAQKAAQIYWQLWHDYPESAYALMARAKLVP